MSTVIAFAEAAKRHRPELTLVPPPPATPVIETCIAAWLRSKHDDGHRRRGVKNYEEVITRFVTWARITEPGEITELLVRQYKSDLMGRCAASTTRHALTVVRAFCGWCVEEDYLARNVALRVKHPRVTSPDPDPLSRAQIGALLSALDTPAKTHKATWRRNRRAVFLMLYAGLRLAETAGLEWRDLDLDRRTLTVRSEIAKGGKPRVLPICEELAAELATAVKRRPTWAVVDKGEGTGQGQHLTEKSLAHVFERWVPMRLGFSIHAHQLRKTFATELYVRGEDLATIQRLLGHADPKTTMRYVAASSSKERAAVEKLRFQAEPPGSC
jgi:site-specific recombinase XerD